MPARSAVERPRLIPALRSSPTTSRRSCQVDMTPLALEHGQMGLELIAEAFIAMAVGEKNDSHKTLTS